MILPAAGQAGAGPTARESYEQQDFDSAIKACQGNAHECLVLRALCYAEKCALYDQKADKAELNSLKKALADVLGVSDLEMLSSLGAIRSNPGGAELASELAVKVLGRARSVEDMDAVLSVIRAAPGERAVKAALKALQRHLEQVRKYVDDGGTMPAVERRFFLREDMLNVLVGVIDSEECGSLARACLVLVEEPALVMLEEHGGKRALDTTRKIHDAIAKREKKRPAAAWHGGARED